MNDIQENGVCIGVLANLPGEIIDVITNHMAKVSGQPVDWYWLAGHARIVTTGNAREVQQTLPAVVRTDVISRCSCKDFPGADEFCMAHKGVSAP